MVGMVCSLWALILGPSVLALEGKKKRGRRPPAANGDLCDGQGKDSKRQKRVKASRRKCIGIMSDLHGVFQRQVPG